MFTYFRILVIFKNIKNFSKNIFFLVTAIKNAIWWWVFHLNYIQLNIHLKISFQNLCKNPKSIISKQTFWNEMKLKRFFMPNISQALRVINFVLIVTFLVRQYNLINKNFPLLVLVENFFVFLQQQHKFLI